jgi:hypothetical protein
MTLDQTTESGSKKSRSPKGEKIAGETIAEGKTTRAIEQVTARAPSQVWLWAAGAAITGSLALYLTGRRQAGIFVGLWPLTFLVMGNYNKIVKSIGSTGEREAPATEWPGAPTAGA